MKGLEPAVYFITASAMDRLRPAGARSAMNKLLPANVVEHS